MPMVLATVKPEPTVEAAWRDECDRPDDEQDAQAQEDDGQHP